MREAKMESKNKELQKILDGINDSFSHKPPEGRDKFLDDKIDRVLALLKEGADVNLKTSRGEPLLSSACYWDNIEIFDFLLENGADIEAIDKNGMTPLMHAAEWFSPDCIMALVQAGANVHAKDKHGMTALMFASRGMEDHYFGDGLMSYHRVILPLLWSKHKADINEKDNDGYTALHHACSSNAYYEIIELLVRFCKADVNAVDNLGITPLMLICKHLYLFDIKDKVKLLLDHGARTDLMDKYGRTALMFVEAKLQNTQKSEYDTEEYEEALKNVICMLKGHAYNMHFANFSNIAHGWQPEETFERWFENMFHSDRGLLYSFMDFYYPELSDEKTEFGRKYFEKRGITTQWHINKNERRPERSYRKGSRI